jgi:hypothetical protein
LFFVFCFLCRKNLSARFDQAEYAKVAHFKKTTLQWFGRVIFTAPAKKWSEKQTRAFILNIVHHLSNSHQGCPPDSMCMKTPGFIPRKPNLVGEDAAPLRTLLTKLITSVFETCDGVLLGTSARTSSIENLWSVNSSQYCPKHKDLPKSARSRTLLHFLEHNTNLSSAVTIVLSNVNPAFDLRCIR